MGEVGLGAGLVTGAEALAEDGAAAPEFSRSGREARADGRARYDPLAKADLNPAPDIA